MDGHQEYDKYVEFPCGKLFIEESVSHEFIYLVDLPWMDKDTNKLTPIFIDKLASSAWDDEFIVLLSEDIWPFTITFIRVATEELFQVEIENNWAIQDDFEADLEIKDKQTITIRIYNYDSDETFDMKAFFFDRAAMTLDGKQLKPIPRWQK
jgi:hypothetical protein